MKGRPRAPGRSGNSSRRSYRHLWTATTTSAFGNGVVVSALPLLAAGMTRRPLGIAALSAAEGLPWLLLALPAGVLVDRFDRRRLMQAADGVRALVLVLMVLGIMRHILSLFTLYAFAVLLGTGQTLSMGATTAMLPGIVPTEDLPRANGLLASTQMLGEQTIGPVLGSLLFGVAAAFPFAVDGISFLGSALVLSGVPDVRASSRQWQAGQLRHEPVMRSARAGLAWFLGQPVLVVLVATIAAMAFSQSMMLGVLVLFALRCLHIARSGYGLLLAIGALGAAVSGAAAKTVLGRLGTSRTILAAGLVAGAAYVTLWATSSAEVAGAALFVEGGAVMAGNVASNVVRQSLIPSDMLGRVGNVTRMFIWGAVPLGALAGGAAATAWGLRAPLLLAGGLQVATVAVAARPLLRLLPPSPDTPSVAPTGEA